MAVEAALVVYPYDIDEGVVIEIVTELLGSEDVREVDVAEVAIVSFGTVATEEAGVTEEIGVTEEPGITDVRLFERVA